MFLQTRHYKGILLPSSLWLMANFKYVAACSSLVCACAVLFHVAKAEPIQTCAQDAQHPMTGM